jgi:hypothetical protein
MWMSYEGTMLLGTTSKAIGQIQMCCLCEKGEKGMEK